MWQLFRAEWRRVLRRRITLFTVLGIIAATALFAFAMFSSTKAPTADEIARSEQAYQRALDDWERNGAGQVAQCKQDEAANQEMEPGVDFRCDELKPTKNQYIYPQPTLAETQAPVPLVAGMLAVLGAVLIGASMIGAEFATGSIGNWLTFEPRRSRVYATKLLAVALGGLALGAVTVALLTGGGLLVAQLNNQDTTVEAGFWAHQGWSSLRAVLLTAAAAAGGAALGFITRHTAAVIGIGIGYLVLVESILVNFATWLHPFLLTGNVQAWIQGSAQYSYQKCSPSDTGIYSCESMTGTISNTHAGLELLIVLAVLAVAGWLLFRRRDVA